jgi:general secretion pathway protein C
MRLAAGPRTGALFRRLPKPPTALVWVELLLLVLIAVQTARLFWTVVTPVDPVGDWRADTLRPAPLAAVPGSFDPFFRLSGGPGSAVVTSLDIRLYGVREDRATGRGSAIIGLPDGQQGSFAVGEEIMPGVTLAAVGFDSITINRNGTDEQVFLDQSAPAETVGSPGVEANGAIALETVEAPPAYPPIRFEPRMSGGRMTGIAVQPGGSGDAFRAAGFAPGDVIVSIDGRPIGSIEEARARIEGARGEINLVVERAGRPVPLRVRLNP